MCYHDILVYNVDTLNSAVMQSVRVAIKQIPCTTAGRGPPE